MKIDYQWYGITGLILDILGFLIVFLFGDFKSLYSRVTHAMDNKLSEAFKESEENRRRIDEQELIIQGHYMQMQNEYPKSHPGINVNDLYLELLIGNQEPQNSIENYIVRENQVKNIFIKKIQPLAMQINELQKKRKQWRLEYIKKALNEDRYSFIGFIMIFLGFMFQIYSNWLSLHLPACLTCNLICT